MVHILEALVPGMDLKKTSTYKRICFAAAGEVHARDILSSLWDVREFRHLDIEKVLGDEGRAGTLDRLSLVYSKLQIWNLLAEEIDVAIMMDADVWVQKSMDHNSVYWNVERWRALPAATPISP